MSSISTLMNLFFEDDELACVVVVGVAVLEVVTVFIGAGSPRSFACNASN